MLSRPGQRERLAKSIIFIATAVVLVSPLLRNMWLWPTGTIAESSVYSLDRHLFFAQFAHDHSVFMAGERSAFISAYAPWYGLWSVLATVLPDSIAYLTLVAVFYSLALFFLAKLLILVSDRCGVESTTAEWGTACLLGLLFLSSPSIFNYLKSNIFFTLPYLVLPIALFLALKYLRSGDKRFIVGLLFVAILIADVNIAHAAIIVLAIDLFLVSQRAVSNVSWESFLRRALFVNAALIPGLCWMLAAAYANTTYPGTLASFAAAAAENMYSDNARYLNIFTQLTDWGLFGSWNGVPYYAFAQFYADLPVWALGLFPFVTLGFASCVSRASAMLKHAASWLLLGAAATFQLMLGNNNALFRLLYDHVALFQIFRNISKLAPALYLAVLVATFILLRDRLRDRTILISTIALTALALAYNLPFWTYQDSFFADRSVRAVPTYWSDAARFIDTTADPSSKVLALPAIYVNDIFDWGDKRTWVQGSLLDVLTRHESYRLSECCLGSTTFQADARGVFIASTRSIRNLDVDYGRLTRFAKKYHLDYVVVSTDLLSEYQRDADIRRWLAAAGYQRVATFGAVDVYRNPANFAPLISAGKAPISRADGLQYNVDIRRLARPTELILREPYHSGWEAFAEGPGPHGGSIIAQLRRLFDNSGRIEDHRSGGEDENIWRIDPASIPAGYSSVGLYFRPQLVFFALLIAGAAIFSILLLVLLAQILARGKGRLSIRLGIAVAAIALTVFPPIIVSSIPAPRETPAKPAPRISPVGARVALAPGSGRIQISRFHATGLRDTSWKVGPCGDPAIARADLTVDSTGAAVVSVAPIMPGRCHFAVLARSATSGNVASTQVDVSIRSELSLRRSAPASQTGVIFTTSAFPAASLPVFAGNDWSDVPLKIDASSCAGIASVAQPDLPQGSTAHATIEVAPIGPGACRALAMPRDGSSRKERLQIFVRTMGALSFSSRRMETRLAIAFSGPRAAPQSVQFYKRFGEAPLTMSIIGGDCASVVAILRRSAKTSATPALQTGAGQVVVRPLARGACHALLTDQYLESPVDLRISIGGRRP